MGSTYVVDAAEDNMYVYIGIHKMNLITIQYIPDETSKEWMGGGKDLSLYSI